MNFFKQNKSAKQPTYFPAVDFLRGCGAFVILVWHYHHFYFQKAYYGPTNGPASWDYARQPFYEFLYPFYHYGFWAVQFFWLLSGFVFAFVYMNKSPSAKEFFILRFSRLYPLHFISLLIITVLQFLSLNFLGEHQILEINDLYHFVLNLFFAQYWGLQEGVSFNSPSWSISLEELVYWGFWVFAIKLGYKNLKTTLFPIFLVFFATLFVGIYAWAFFYFFLGAAVFYFQSNYNFKVNVLGFFLSVFLASVFMFIYINVDKTIASLSLDFLARYSWTMKSYSFNGCASFFFCALLFLASSIDKAELMPNFSGSFRFVGSLTYSTYMLHLSIQVLVLMFFSFFGFNREVFDQPLSFILWIFVMVLVGRASYVYIERPLQTVIRKKYLN